jgi:hypothetical protein
VVGGNNLVTSLIKSLTESGTEATHGAGDECDVLRHVNILSNLKNKNQA